jgi:hypothetical protein
MRTAQKYKTNVQFPGSVPHTGTCEKTLGWGVICDCGADRYLEKVDKFLTGLGVEPVEGVLEEQGDTK